MLGTGQTMHGLLRSSESVTGQDVIGQREPVEHRVHFVASAHGELIEAPLSEAGVDAFAHGSPFIDAPAMRTAHAPAPGSNAGLVITARRIGIALVLVVGGWPVHLHACVRGPFDVGILVEATIDKMALRQSAGMILDPIEHWPEQGAVCADRLGADPD